MKTKINIKIFLNEWKKHRAIKLFFEKLDMEIKIKSFSRRAKWYDSWYNSQFLTSKI